MLLQTPVNESSSCGSPDTVPSVTLPIEALEASGRLLEAAKHIFTDLDAELHHLACSHLLFAWRRLSPNFRMFMCDKFAIEGFNIYVRCAADGEVLRSVDGSSAAGKVAMVQNAIGRTVADKARSRVDEPMGLVTMRDRRVALRKDTYDCLARVGVVNRLRAMHIANSMCECINNSRGEIHVAGDPEYIDRSYSMVNLRADTLAVDRSPLSATLYDVGYVYGRILLRAGEVANDYDASALVVDVLAPDYWRSATMYADSWVGWRKLVEKAYRTVERSVLDIFHPATLYNAITAVVEQNGRVPYFNSIREMLLYKSVESMGYTCAEVVEQQLGYALTHEEKVVIGNMVIAVHDVYDARHDCAVDNLSSTVVQMAGRCDNPVDVVASSVINTLGALGQEFRRVYRRLFVSTVYGNELLVRYNRPPLKTIQMTKDNIYAGLYRGESEPFEVKMTGMQIDIGQCLAMWGSDFESSWHVENAAALLLRQGYDVRQVKSRRPVDVSVLE